MTVWILFIAYCIAKGISRQRQYDSLNGTAKTTKPSNHFRRAGYSAFTKKLLSLHSDPQAFVAVTLYNLTQLANTWMEFENAYLQALILQAPTQEIEMLAKNRRVMSALVRQIEETTFKLN